MKHLITTALLLLCISAQSQTMFSRNYTSEITCENGIRRERQPTDVTVVYNYNNTAKVYVLYPNGVSASFYPQSYTKSGETVNGDTWQAVECVDEAGNNVLLQLFDDDTCLRIIVALGYYVEFYR